MLDLIILGCIIAILLYVLASKRKSSSNLNLPPLVRYKFPIIGHTFSYMFNPEEFLIRCKKEYGDIFSLYVFGRVFTVIGKEHLHEAILRIDAFDFKRAFLSRIPVADMFKHTFGDLKDGERIVRTYITDKMDLYSERMQTNLISAIQELIGECEEPRRFHLLCEHIIKAIAIPMADIFIGEEDAKDKDVRTTFAELTKIPAVLSVIPPIFDIIYPGLQKIVISIPFKLGLNPIAKHRNFFIRRLKNRMDKRLREKQLHGDSWKRPDDVLQDLMDEKKFDSNNIDYEAFADKMAGFIFAAIHTTSRSSTNALIDLASRPEIMQELYEEQLQIHKEADDNGVLPAEAVNKMVKLDSFVRESLRLTGDIIAAERVALKDYTFSNGLQVPEGHIVGLYFDDVYSDKTIQGPNPKSFEPFRHLYTNTPATKFGKGYLAFGGGKHPCPGRFFAVNEIKIFLHNIILKYNVRTESGKVEGCFHVGPISIPGFGGIVFEKRR